jgi:hypothetical protein
MTTGLNTYKTTGRVLGVKLGATSATPNSKLGETVSGDFGTEWRYVQASAAIAAGAAVVISSANIATQATTNLTGGSIGFAQNAFAAGEYGWVAQRGKLNVLVSGTATAGVQMYVGASGGLTTTATSGTLEGIFLPASTSATAVLALNPIVATWPHQKSL